MSNGFFDYDAYYKKVSPVYDDIRLDSESDFSMTIKMILKNIRQDTVNFLDIGCGTGRYGQALVQRGYNVEGIDKSSSQIEQAKKIIKACQGNVVDLPYLDDSFDACIMIMMIHHLTAKERELAFDEIFRVLKEKGVLIIKTASHEDLKYRISSRFFSEALDIDLNRYPNIDILKNELSKFEKIQMQKTISVSSFNKNEMVRKLAMRRTSNLGMLSEDALRKGIARFEDTYQNQEIIQKENHNTFIIAQK